MADTLKIAVAPEHPEQLGQAAELSTRLGLPLTKAGDREYSMLLVVTALRLELRRIATSPPGPVYVDFLSGKADYRRRYGSSRDEAVIRAVASKRNRTPTVLDATGGLGRDAFVLAAHGCRVLLIERHPIIAALLADGLKRGATNERIGPMIRERMHLVVGDSAEIMRQLPERERPEAVYLDPMYPQGGKSAQVKKETVLLRLLAGPDQGSETLLDAALACARQRVVVKRPLTAPPLADRLPDLRRNAGAHRFDIYLTG